MRVLALLATAVKVVSQELGPLPEKQPLNPKLEGHLAELVAASRGVAKPLAGAMLSATADGRIVVVLVPPQDSTSAVIDTIGLHALGGQVLARSTHLVRAAVPIEQLAAVAELSGVCFVRQPIRPSHQAVVSEGASRVNALANHSRGVRGAGVKIAVIDVGFTGTDNLRADMPESWRYFDFTGTGMYAGGPHGTACAEVVYDVAPDAQLYLYRVDDEVDLERAKDRCITDGVHIVSQSLAWLGLGFGDGEGLACDIVNAAAVNGILWVNGAGNYARKQYSAYWADRNDDGWHNVEGSGEGIGLERTAIGDTIEVWLTWNDWPTTSDNYDLALYRLVRPDSVVVVSGSRTRQSGSAPVEHIVHRVSTSDPYRLAVWKDRSARATAFKVFSENHELGDLASLVGNLGTPADARGVVAVGAIHHANWARGLAEDYSSRGPTADGRTKPDLMGPDGVSTATYGYQAFGGTSAAAPHVAAAAALIKSSRPSMSRQELVDALTAAAVDLGEPGKDNIYGFGKLVLPLLTPAAVASITSAEPASLQTGQVLTIRGVGFGATRGGGYISFAGGVLPISSQYLRWSDREIRVTVPLGAQPGTFTVRTNSGQSATMRVTITSPWITAVSPSTARAGEIVTLQGGNFGTTRGTSTISIRLLRATSYRQWSSSSVRFQVPVNARSGSIDVRTSTGQSNRLRLEVTSPHLATITPTRAAPGDTLTMTGEKFGSLRGTSYVMIGTLAVGSSDYLSWSATRVRIRIPGAAVTGPVKVVTTAGQSGELTLTVEAPSVLALPAAGPFGYDPPSVNRLPRGVSFEFDAIGRDLSLTYELRDVGTSEIALYVNGAFWSYHPESSTGRSWWQYLASASLRQGRDVVEFRHVANQGRTTGFETWRLWNVTLWKPYNAKPLAADFITDSPPTATLLGAPYPSPFNAEVVIPFQLAEPGTVRITIYNMAGQVVRRLQDGELAAGTQSVHWDGTDATEVPAASGVYVVLLDTGRLRASTRALLLR